MPLDCYKGKIRATFTMCIENSKPAFVERVVVDEFVDVLTQAKDKYNCINWVYIFMPDHLHLILEGKLENADLWKAMVLFKQKTGFWLSKNKQAIKWQKDFMIIYIEKTRISKSTYDIYWIILSEKA